ncbi:probable ubiquitin carboxyl-terminal hydrolase creB [Poecilia reticulata]|uniref:Ubiquitin carboxyl-terminal hydrolase n=1 Tax=Poecilia reticulata TaxID=8081 RepID=A0A3P9NDA5_POERE|nr:PREDICTED: probable ubiquitin carboxyl-terminal hydrolase creB [Poecilia reticulata]
MSGWWNKPADVKYRGLVNHGATCYLNSVLQVLFMTEEFREAVIRLTSPSEEYIDHLLKGLFGELLKRTELLSVDPYSILKALGVNNVCEQQDAAEYFERILRKTGENAAKIFHGRLSHRTECLNCKKVTDSEGPFWHLPLELEDSFGGNYSVENGIKMFFTPTIFDGDNQMYCDRCDDKVDAARKYVITRHPDVLLLMLKRFDFSYQYMSYIKINHIAEVPHTIEIPENQSYELYAVVEHFGDLRGGHYQAVIKSKDEGGEWFVFNDSSVTQLGMNPFPDNVSVVPSSTAYLLFYRKKVADCVISGLCSVRDSNPNIFQDQSQKENLQLDNSTKTLDENISDKEGKIVHMSTEAEPEVRNPEKREINESEEINPYEQRLPEEQTGRERQSERFSQDETKYPPDITMEDAEEQEENRNQLNREDQIQGLVAGETEPTKFGNMQTDNNYDDHVESAEPVALQENLWEHQILPEEVKRKHETENSNTLITTSEEAGTADEAEYNKLLATKHLRYNYNQAENAALNKLEKTEENEQIGEEASDLKENLSTQDNDNIPQSLLNPDENHPDNKHQRRKEMTVDVSKTQPQETEGIDKTHFHKDRPKVDKSGKSKQKDEQSQIRGKRNRSDQGKRENQDHTDRTGENQVEAYSDSPQPYHDEGAEVIKKKHTKKVQTSHDAQNELDLKKNRKNKNYKMAATLIGNQEADGDEETRQENFQSYRNKGSEDAEVRRPGSNQAALERKTIEEDIREFSPSGKDKTKLMIKTITEETRTVNNSNNRKQIKNKNEGNVDLERGNLPSAKEETTILSEPLLLEQQNPTSKKTTRGAKEDEYRLNISSDTDLEAQQKRHDIKKKRS